ncbi:DUF2911 domain-containing protein [Reichenbachiella sp. MALMAid0571]|uniref:DUF2911 domain-containing protein n=1 Tax=Reichenbachiella sp. MALMAid0571 TaxID=3143939 RepID=UPI0032DE563E
MKHFLYSLLLVLSVSTVASAQSFRALDKSPMDVAYLPDNFAHDRDPGQKAIVKVYYSQPQKKGREIFGTLVPYGKVWRLGANEAVELKAYQDITVGGKKLKAGTYSLFAIPDEKEWMIIVSSDLDYWGAYSYNEGKDVLRVKVPVKSLSSEVEAFSIRFEDKGKDTAVMRMGWDKTMVEVPLNY